MGIQVSCFAHVVYTCMPTAQWCSCSGRHGASCDGSRFPLSLLSNIKYGFREPIRYYPGYGITVACTYNSVTRPATRSPPHVGGGYIVGAPSRETRACASRHASQATTWLELLEASCGCGLARLHRAVEAWVDTRVARLAGEEDGAVDGGAKLWALPVGPLGRVRVCAIGPGLHVPVLD